MEEYHCWQYCCKGRHNPTDYSSHYLWYSWNISQGGRRIQAQDRFWASWANNIHYRYRWGYRERYYRSWRRDSRGRRNSHSHSYSSWGLQARGYHSYSRRSFCWSYRGRRCLHIRYASSSRNSICYIRCWGCWANSRTPSNRSRVHKHRRNCRTELCYHQQANRQDSLRYRRAESRIWQQWGCYQGNKLWLQLQTRYSSCWCRGWDNR